MNILVTYSESTGVIYNLCGDVKNLENEKFSVSLSDHPTRKVKVFSVETDTPFGNWYVDLSTNTLKEQQVLDTLVVNNGRISGIPDNTVVTWPDGVKTTESKELEFESNVSGSFGFVFDSIKYLRHSLEVQYNV